MTDKMRRIPDWVNDIRESMQNIRSDIGEAANNIMKLAPGLKQSNPDTWQHLDDVYAMRIRLTHSYHRTNPNIVFDTVQTDLPGLELLLSNILLAQGAAFGPVPPHQPKK